MKNLELLSPAGDFKIFKAVIDAGADAVYFGGDLFGARAFAKNFSFEDAIAAIKYAHIHGAKAYLTVNTLLKNLEIENALYEYLKTYVENGIDAFIVQDFGVFNFIKSYFPDTEIHASTQMSLCTAEGARFISNFGASRIVTARELSLQEISKIHQSIPELEIESFIHGALCVCYSGQCLMSSIIGGRSGNRGRCAQPCRLPYKAFRENGERIQLPGNYILSPKDFCTIDSLPQMIDAGVCSFKIEGRMKQLEYAKGVVSIYRKYLDDYLNSGGDNYQVTPKDIEKLLNFGNRCGFTDLYLTKHNGKEMMTFKEPSHTKMQDSVVDSIESKIKIDCQVDAALDNPFKITFSTKNGEIVSVEGDLCQAANSRFATSDEIKQAVCQLGNTSFEIDEIIINLEEGLFLPVSLIKRVRRQALEMLESRLLSNDNKEVRPFVKRNFGKNTVITDPSVISVQVSSLEQLEIVENYDFVSKVFVPVALLSEALQVSKKSVYAVLPQVIRADYIDSILLNVGEAGVLVMSYDGLGLLEKLNYDKEKVILDHRLYIFSNRAKDAFADCGYKLFCMPYELSIKELSHLDNSNSQMIIYSRIPLMITANCSLKNSNFCNKENQHYKLVDRKKEEFDVVCDCNYCYNTIYNGKKYTCINMADEVSKLGFKEYRIDFSVEKADEVKFVMSMYKKAFLEHEKVSFGEGYTKGHLKRGVD